MYLDDLPRNYKGIIWKDCIGKEIRFIYNDINGSFKITNYKKEILTIEYKGEEHTIRRNHFIKGSIGRVIGVINKDYIVDIGDIITDNNRDIIIIDRDKRGKYNNRYYKYRCNKDGNEDWISERHLIADKVGCNVCSNIKLMKGVNDIPTTTPWMVKYFQGGIEEASNYMKGTLQKIYPICPYCGKISGQRTIISNIYKTKTIRCECGDKMTLPNKFIRFLMIELKEIYDIKNISFEYSPEWISPKRYDCYFELNNNRYIIEMDGGFGHGHKLVHYKEKYTKETLKEIDEFKDECAKKEGIEVIRIDCNYRHNDPFIYIKDNIVGNKILSSIFEFTKINWKNIDIGISNNIHKQICEVKNRYNFLSTKEVGSLFGIDRTNANKILKKGYRIGWCNEDYSKLRVISKTSDENLKKIKEELAKDGYMVL